jgi:hypothetical protein
MHPLEKLLEELQHQLMPSAKPLLVNQERLLEAKRDLRIVKPVRVTFLPSFDRKHLEPGSDGRWELRGRRLHQQYHQIWLRSGYRHGPTVEVLLHELRHAHQAEAWFGVKSQAEANSIYGLASATAAMQGGHPYLDNLMERDARHFAMRHKSHYRDILSVA